MSTALLGKRRFAPWTRAGFWLARRFNAAYQGEKQHSRQVQARLEAVERGGEKLAIEVRGYLAEACNDDPDHPVWNGPLARGLAEWNRARNSIWPDLGDTAALHPEGRIR